MEGDRTILHCDCNGFFASVECLLNPALKDVPMAVCGDPESRRGIILAKNEPAKKYHIQTAETIWQARKKCPGLVLVSPHREMYQKYSRLVNDIYHRYTDLVEPFSIDESWLDVTDSRFLFGDGKAIADELRRVVREELGLTISVGVSFNKVFAKMGSDYKKPDATTVISRENFQTILFPLPVTSLLFVGSSTAASLGKLGIRSIGDLAGSDRRAISGLMGKIGETLYEYANGLDDSPVRLAREEREIKSVGNSITFPRNLEGQDDIRLGLEVLSDSVATRLRRHGLKCATVQIMIKNPSLKSISRQEALKIPTFLSSEIEAAAMRLVEANWNMKAPIRMLAVAGAKLVPADGEGQQLSLFSEENMEGRDKREQLETTVDFIRSKFGKSSVSTASVLHSDLGISEEEEIKSKLE